MFMRRAALMYAAWDLRAKVSATFMLWIVMWKALGCACITQVSECHLGCFFWPWSSISLALCQLPGTTKSMLLGWTPVLRLNGSSPPIRNMLKIISYGRSGFDSSSRKLGRYRSNSCHHLPPLFFIFFCLPEQAYHSNLGHSHPTADDKHSGGSHHHKSDFDWDSLTPSVTLDDPHDSEYNPHDSAFEEWKQVLASEDPAVLSKVSDLLQEVYQRENADKDIDQDWHYNSDDELDNGNYELPAGLRSPQPYHRAKPEGRESPRPRGRWDDRRVPLGRRGGREKRHVGIHDEGGLQRLISTGELLLVNYVCIFWWWIFMICWPSQEPWCLRWWIPPTQIMATAWTLCSLHIGFILPKQKLSFLKTKTALMLRWLNQISALTPIVSYGSILKCPQLAINF